jgi:hypothetical protein
MMVDFIFFDYDNEHRFAEHELDGFEQWEIMGFFVLVLVRVIVIDFKFTCMPMLSQ